MEQYGSEVDQRLVYLRNEGGAGGVVSPHGTPPLPPHAAAMPVDYSMYNLWHQQQQLQQQHQQQQQQQHGISHNSLHTTGSFNLETQHHQSQQRLLQAHVPLQDTPRDHFLSGLELRDVRLAALEGMLGDIGSRVSTGGSGACGRSNEGASKSDDIGVKLEDASSKMTDVGLRVGDLGATFGDVAGNSRTGGVSGELGSRLGTDGGDKVQTNHAGSGIDGNLVEGTPEFRLACGIEDVRLSAMPNSGDIMRNSVISGGAFGGVAKNSASINDRLFYGDLFNKRNVPTSDGSSAGSFAYDMSLSMVNNLIRSSGLDNTGTSMDIGVPKQELRCDTFPSGSDVDSAYDMQESVSGIDNTNAMRTVNGIFGYSEEFNNFRKGTEPMQQEEHNSRVKLDPYNNLPEGTASSNGVGCGPSSNNATNSPPHINSQIINDQEVFSCTHCLYKTPRKNYLKQHLRTHTGEGKVFCPFCNYSTVWRQRLKHHVLNHGKEKKERPVVNRNRTNFKNSPQSPADPTVVRLKCEYCDYSTPNKNYLKQHTRTHTGDGTISCPECDYKSVWRQRMKRHIMSHRGEKEASCTHCSYSSFDKLKLAKHIEAHGNEVYSCDICSFTTQRKTYMKQHTRTHTGEGKVQCPHCPYETVWKQRLKLHIRKHTGDLNAVARKVPSLQCLQCEFKTCRRDRLRNHMRIHNPNVFLCNFCPYRSTTAALLEHHVETHNRDRGDVSSLTSGAIVADTDALEMNFVTNGICKEFGLVRSDTEGTDEFDGDYNTDVADNVHDKDVQHSETHNVEWTMEGKFEDRAAADEKSSLIQRINEMTDNAHDYSASESPAVHERLTMSILRVNKDSDEYSIVGNNKHHIATEKITRVPDDSIEKYRDLEGTNIPTDCLSKTDDNLQRSFEKLPNNCDGSKKESGQSTSNGLERYNNTVNQNALTSTGYNSNICGNNSEQQHAFNTGANRLEVDAGTEETWAIKYDDHQQEESFKKRIDKLLRCGEKSAVFEPQCVAPSTTTTTTA